MPAPVNQTNGTTRPSPNSAQDFPAPTPRTANTVKAPANRPSNRTTRPAGRAAARQTGTANVGRKYTASPSGAPPSAHSASRLISSCGIEMSFANEPNPFAAGHGGIFRCSTSSFIATAHGRASAYVRNENGATPPG